MLPRENDVFASVCRSFSLIVPIAMTARIYAFSHVFKALNNKAVDLNRFYLTDYIVRYKQKTMETNGRVDKDFTKEVALKLAFLFGKRRNIIWGDGKICIRKVKTKKMSRRL